MQILCHFSFVFVNFVPLERLFLVRYYSFPPAKLLLFFDICKKKCIGGRFFLALALALALAVSAAHTNPIHQETPAWPVGTEGRYPPEGDFYITFSSKKGITPTYVTPASSVHGRV